MSIIIIIICLVLQRLLLLDRYTYHLQGLKGYFHWIVDKVEYVTEGHALAGMLILLLPIVIVFSLLFSLIYHFFGFWVYSVFNFFLLWLCMEGRNLNKKPYLNIPVAEVFVLTYERLFAVIFWFVIFGPAGLILYSATVSLRNFLLTENHTDLLGYVCKLKVLLDWLPIRLLGLSYAIVGHFASVTRVWARHIHTGVITDSRLVVEYGCAALGVHASALDRLYLEAVYLINRALLLWLTIIALFTLVFWLS